MSQHTSIRILPFAFSRPLGTVVLSLFFMVGCDNESGPRSDATDPPAIVEPRAPSADHQRTMGLSAGLNLKATAGHQRMVELLTTLKVKATDEHRYVGGGRVRKMRATLADLPASTPPLQKARMLYLLADAELKLGAEEEAIERYERARELFLTAKSTVRPDLAAGMLIEMDFSLGVAYLRLGETQNCCLRNTPDSCILPIRGSGIHTDKKGSSKAAKHFERVVRATRPAMPFHQRALWLLNIAHMTLGTFPEGIPQEFRLPPESFQSEETFPRFRNISSRLGLDTFGLSGGVIADDFDNDGDLDLLVSRWDPSGQIRYFSNAGDGTFVDQTEAAGLIGILGGLNLVQADYDNDDRLDALVLRGAWLDEQGHHPNSLLRNVGDAEGVKFSDVTFEAGLGEKHSPTQTGSWADFDRDGDLDLYVGNESGPKRTSPVPSELFRNNGDGTFTDVAPAAGVTNKRWSKAVVWGDYDADGFPDLYISNFESENRLYRNNGDGTFHDVAAALGVVGPRESFPAWFWDYDNDGHLDLYVSAYGAEIADLAAMRTGLPIKKETAKLYRNNGSGGFVDVSREARVTGPSAPMGANFGDLDNDGYLDFYLGTGYTAIFQLMPNVMYHNRGGKYFADVTIPGGFGHLQKGHAIAFADFDNDGDQDVFEQMGGAYSADQFHDALYENPGSDNQWVCLKLVGVQSNRSAIGARIRIEVATDSGLRSIYKHVNSGGSFGANPLRQTIGLGDARSIVKVDILWPGQKGQEVEGVKMGRAWKIVEGQGKAMQLPFTRITLSGL